MSIESNNSFIWQKKKKLYGLVPHIKNLITYVEKLQVKRILWLSLFVAIKWYTPRTTDTRWLNPQFFATQIQIPIPNKYLGLVFVEIMID